MQTGRKEARDRTQSGRIDKHHRTQTGRIDKQPQDAIRPLDPPGSARSLPPPLILVPIIKHDVEAADVEDFQRVVPPLFGTSD
jgi:hypothetical protein